MGSDSDPAARYVAELLVTQVREDIGRADTKAAVLLSGALALPVVALSRQPGGGTGPAGFALLGTAGTLWLCGVLMLIGAVLPRTGTLRAGPDLTYYSDALADAGPGHLLAQVSRAGAAPVPWLLTQLRDVSAILARKYRLIRWGVCCLAPALTAAAGHLVWQLR